MLLSLLTSFLYADHANSILAREDLSPQDLAEIYSGSDVCILVVGSGAVTFLVLDEDLGNIYTRALDVGQVLGAERYWVFGGESVDDRLGEIYTEFLQMVQIHNK